MGVNTELLYAGEKSGSIRAAVAATRAVTAAGEVLEPAAVARDRPCGDRRRALPDPSACRRDGHVPPEGGRLRPLAARHAPLPGVAADTDHPMTADFAEYCQEFACPCSKYPIALSNYRRICSTSWSRTCTRPRRVYDAADARIRRPALPAADHRGAQGGGTTTRPVEPVPPAPGPGPGLTNLEYAPLAEIMGRSFTRPRGVQLQRPRHRQHGGADAVRHRRAPGEVPQAAAGRHHQPRRSR